MHHRQSVLAVLFHGTADKSLLNPNGNNFCLTRSEKLLQMRLQTELSVLIPAHAHWPAGASFLSRNTVRETRVAGGWLM